ncbi:uncharacterized protein LOC127747672 [Arachis duranensis]|uniref:Uncharacterized protein LOC127747672 n=1 Tax=Arachis duranensis TaxID=130453 RepID=A0A9C6TYC8_ARADU|nr:uncharacterized protein LOC127747672 [Arachis duranensis]
MAHSKHIDKVLDRHSDETIANNRLRLKTSIDAIRWLAFQACAFRGDDESPGSLNRGNFIELIKLLASCNQNVNNVVLENAPRNAQYISLGVQKDMLHIFARKVRATIREEIEISSVLSHHNLDVQNLRGQSLLCMFDATCEVLEKSTEEGNFSTRGDASATYDAITSSEFVFILHLMRNILEVIHDLCQALQRKNQDILNALTLLQEINRRFNDNMVELLTLSSTLDLRENYKLFSVNKVCELVERFYPSDFSDQKKFHIRIQAQHYELDIPNHVELTNLYTISELCQGLTKIGKSLTYPLIDRLICLVLTLPVSTATTERSFSAMNIVKNRLRNKMEDEFLADCLLIYIEKKIAERFDTNSIIDEFYNMKNRCVPLR